MRREPVCEPVTYHEASPIEYVRGDGKPFWRPCILRVIGSDNAEELAMTEDYHGWSETTTLGWENLTPIIPISSVRLKKISPKLYSSRKKAIRVSKRVVKKYNREQLMLIRKV